MEKELKGRIIEVIFLTIFLIIAVPICVDASNNYNQDKSAHLDAFNATIDVNNKDDYKEITIYSNTEEEIEIKLGLMISKFYDEYYIKLDNNIYKLNSLEYTEDENNRYYIIGTYNVDQEKTINFDLNPVNQEYFKEHLIYSFYAKPII